MCIRDRAITNPEKLFLPKGNLSSKYIFAKNNFFLAYPKNYNHFVNYYKETYQHGGISLEECIIPVSYTHLDVYKRQVGKHPNG